MAQNNSSSPLQAIAEEISLGSREISPCHVTDANMTDVWTGSRSDTSHESSHDDATWILTSAFIIFMMQSGFGLLESGSVASKNEVNIMVKNAVDVIFGGLTYWMFGFGLSFGEDPEWSNPFCGWGYFFVNANETDIGWVYSKFFFQASFATTATTIVSGAMAERAKLESYIVFSMFNTFIVCFPAHWVWAPNGWLANMGMIDIAGAGPVHIVGGVTGLIATLMLKPRYGRFTLQDDHKMGSPSNAVLGLFMLWWGWLGFNCGSTFGISGLKWKLAARSAVATICSSIAGGIVGLLFSYVKENRRFDVPTLINGLLSSLVSITGLCALCEPWMAFCIGAVGALLSLLSIHLLERCHIDDPVGCVGVHAIGGIWSLISVGLFAKNDLLAKGILNSNSKNFGLVNCGTAYLVSVQLLTAVVIIAWTCVTSFVILKTIDLIMGLRVSMEEEVLGSDLVEHGISTLNYRYDKRKKKIIRIDSDEENRNQTIVLTPDGKLTIVSNDQNRSTSDGATNIVIPNGDVPGAKTKRRLLLSGFFKKGIFKSRHKTTSASDRDPEVELNNSDEKDSRQDRFIEITANKPRKASNEPHSASESETIFIG